ERGTHGGRLLEHDEFAVELGIAESGTPPRFQAWLYREGRLLTADAGSVEVRLLRLGNVAENHVLKPRSDGSRMADTIVGEPHSFDVEVIASVSGETMNWTYSSYEG